MYKKRTIIDYIHSWSFYQSEDWKNINILYWREIFKWDYLWKTWWWTIKRSKKLWFCWLQTLWISWYDEDEFLWLYFHLEKILKKYNWIFLQIWFTDNIWIVYKCKNLYKNNNEFYINKRDEIIWDFNQLNYKKSVIENMPLSNIFYDVKNNNIWEYTNQTKKLLNKSLKYDTVFWELTDIDLNLFYQKWSDIWKLKWFNIVNYKQFSSLYNLNNIKIFVIKDQTWNILAWHICYLYKNNILIYLYWFVERNWYNWIWQLMIHNIFNYCINNNIQYYDSWWWSPSWYDKHDLLSVSKFKESFWWYKIEYFGNYDIVNNNLLKKIIYWLLNKFYFKKHT